MVKLNEKLDKLECNVTDDDIKSLVEKNKQILNLGVKELNIYKDLDKFMRHIDSNEREMLQENENLKFENGNLKFKVQVLNEQLEKSNEQSVKIENELNELKYKFDELKSLNELNNASLSFSNSSIKSFFSTTSLSENEFEVSRILRDRFINGNREFLVKWRNYSQ
jgi:hypothetical protein